MAETDDLFDVSWSPEFKIVERDDTTLVGFESDADNRMFDDLYEPEKWLNYLLDPGDEATHVSESYMDNTAALQLVGLTVADELLEYDETRETVMDYQEDLEEMTVLGYSEELRSYANDVLLKMDKLD